MKHMTKSEEKKLNDAKQKLINAREKYEKLVLELCGDRNRPVKDEMGEMGLKAHASSDDPPVRRMTMAKRSRKKSAKRKKS